MPSKLDVVWRAWLQKTKAFSPITVGIVLSGLYALTGTLLMPIGILDNDRIYRTPSILSTTDFLLFAGGLFLSLGLLYWLILNARHLSKKSALLIVGICTLPFLFMYPGDSADFFGTLWYAERFVYLNENPYVTVYDPITHAHVDTVLPPTPQSPILPYGPFWLYVQSLLYLVSPWHSLIGIVFFFKLIHIVLLLSTAYILFSILEIRNRLNLLPYALGLMVSPVVLFSFIGNMHNDIWITLALSVSLWLYAKNRIHWAYGTLLTSVLFKYTPLILVPFWVLICWKQKPHVRNRIGLAVVTTVYATITGVLVYKLQFLNGIADQAGLVSFSLLQAFSLFISSAQALEIIKSTMVGIFVALYLVLLLNTYSSGKVPRISQLANYSLATLSAFLLFFIHMWTYWYVTWLLPFISVTVPKYFWKFLYLSNLHILNFMWCWHLYLQLISQSLSKELFVIRLCVSIIVTFLATTAILTRAYILPSLAKN